MSAYPSHYNAGGQPQPQPQYPQQDYGGGNPYQQSPQEGGYADPQKPAPPQAQPAVDYSYGQPQQQAPPPAAAPMPLHEAAPSAPVAIVNPSATPEGMTPGDPVDTCLIEKFNTLLLIICAIGAFFALGAAIGIIFSQSGETIGTFLFCGIGSAVLAFFTENQQADFDKGAKEFRLVRQRLILAPCKKQDIIARCPFAELPDPILEIGASTGQHHPGAALASVYLELRERRVRLISKHVHSQADQEQMIGTWRQYVDGCRGRPTFAGVVGGVAQAVVGAMGI